jgi:hypothetical protein
VRRDATTHQILTNIGFHVSFENSLHTTGATDDEGTTKGLFSFALPDTLPPTGSDRAEVQLWKTSSNSPSYDPSEPTDVLLYDKTQQQAPPQSLGFATLGSATPAKYTDTPAIDELHPALSDGAGWIAWDQLSSSGFHVIEVAPTNDVSKAVEVPTPDLGASAENPAWNSQVTALAYEYAGDLYTQSVDLSGATPTFGTPTRIYDANDVGGPPPGHDPTWSHDGNSIAFAADGDIWKIPATGGTPTQLTHDTDSRDPSWSHTVGDDRIAYSRGPDNCAAAPKLYVVNPDGSGETRVGDAKCSLSPSFGTNGRIAFVNDGNIWSIKPDGTDTTQLTIGGQDSFPSAAGNIIALDRLFSSGCDGAICLSQQDIMLTSLTATGNTAFSAESTAPLKAEVDHVVNGTAFPVYLGVEPNDVNGAIQTWYINFDGSNAPSGGVLQTLFTDGVQYTTGTSTVAPTVAPKPPTAAIFSPLDTTYPQGATFALSGTGYDAEGEVLQASSLTWTLKLPNGTTYPLPSGGHFASTDLRAPLPGGWPVGTLTFTLVANDGSATSEPVTRHVEVVGYDLVGGGFLPPILNPPLINKAKPGTQYPIKWQLKDVSGKYITDLKTVDTVEYATDGTAPSCNFFTTTGPFTPLPTGKTVLRYDSTNNYFIYNWTTPSTPGCYVFQLTLAGGDKHQAWFQLS